MAKLVRPALIGVFITTTILAGGIARADTAPESADDTVSVMAGNSDCSSLSNGELCASAWPLGSNAQIGTSYHKTGGTQITTQLGYSLNGVKNYNGTITMNVGETRNASWTPSKGGVNCPPVKGLLKTVGQGEFDTPPVYPC
ncbi:hypothetical protein ACQP2K_35120 [Microbispora siamensis]